MKFAVNAPVVFMLQDRIDERTIRLVELSQLHNHLCNWMLMRRQVLLGKRRCPCIGLGVVQPQFLEHRSHRRSRPRFYLHTCLAMDLQVQFLDLGL